MRLRWLPAVGLALSSTLTFGVKNAGAAGPATFTCTGSVSSLSVEPIPGGTYTALSMPAGTACDVVSPVTVLQPVSLGTGSLLSVDGGKLTVLSSLTVGTDAAFGNVLDGTYPIKIGGLVRVITNGYLSMGTETPYGPIVNTIAGPVMAKNASAIQIHNTKIESLVNIQGGGADNPIVSHFAGPCSSFNDLEDNTISGPVTMVGYDGVWAGILRNKIAGPLTFNKNIVPACYIAQLPPGQSAEYDIGSNHIAGFATCSNNVPAPNLGGDPGYLSIVEGPSLGNQAVTCAGVPTGVSGPPV